MIINKPEFINMNMNIDNDIDNNADDNIDNDIDNDTNTIRYLYDEDKGDWYEDHHQLNEYDDSELIDELSSRGYTITRSQI